MYIPSDDRPIKNILRYYCTSTRFSPRQRSRRTPQRCKKRDASKNKEKRLPKHFSHTHVRIDTKKRVARYIHLPGAVDRRDGSQHERLPPHRGHRLGHYVALERGQHHLVRWSRRGPVLERLAKCAVEQPETRPALLKHEKRRRGCEGGYARFLHTPSFRRPPRTAKGKKPRRLHATASRPKAGVCTNICLLLQSNFNAHEHILLTVV